MKPGGCQKERQICLLMTQMLGRWAKFLKQSEEAHPQKGQAFGKRLGIDSAFRVIFTLENTFSKRGRRKKTKLGAKNSGQKEETWILSSGLSSGILASHPDS